MDSKDVQRNARVKKELKTIWCPGSKRERYCHCQSVHCDRWVKDMEKGNG